MNEKIDWKAIFTLPVIVAALGYFVDIFDLQMFGIVRLPSLKSIGLDDAQASSIGGQIINWQMVGLLAGGILWGMLGDKKGRLSVLFGSIITYSIANIGCGLVHSVEAYKIWRLIAGIGLAGELGAGITLVSETVPIKFRALATSIVAAVGLLGAVVGFLTVEFFNWRTAYFAGGVMGFLLLLLRIGVFESEHFKNIKEVSHISKGNFFELFTDKERLTKYLKCIGIGIPSWFVIGTLLYYSNEFGKSAGIENIKPGQSIMWAYFGLSISDFVSGFIVHALKSRKKTVLLFLLFSIAVVLIYLFAPIHSASLFYLLAFFLGVGNGYWALFVTIAAEQFGTNLRATATTTVPNMVRGSAILTLSLYQWLKTQGIHVSIAAAIVGAISFSLSLYSILTISETHDKDLNYLEK